MFQQFLDLGSLFGGISQIRAHEADWQETLLNEGFLQRKVPRGIVQCTEWPKAVWPSGVINDLLLLHVSSNDISFDSEL